MDIHIRNLKVTPRDASFGRHFFCLGFGVRVRDNSGRGSGFGGHAIKHNTLCVGAPTNMMSRISAAAQKFFKKIKAACRFFVLLCCIMWYQYTYIDIN